MGVQLELPIAPHSFGLPPPPQVSPFGHGNIAVQSITPPLTSTPQPFETMPHLPSHASAGVSGVQVPGEPHC
jgi:hypothetical protein